MEILAVIIIFLILPFIDSDQPLTYLLLMIVVPIGLALLFLISNHPGILWIFLPIGLFVILGYIIYYISKL